MPQITSKQRQLFAPYSASVLEAYSALASFFYDWNMKARLGKSAVDWRFDKEAWGNDGIFVSARPKAEGLQLEIHSPQPLESPAVRSRRQASANDCVHQLIVTSAEQFWGEPADLIQRACDAIEARR